MKNTAACKVSGFLGAAALIVGCQTTDIHLRVLAPGEADLSGSTARMIIGDEPLCGGGLLYAGRTEPAGKLWIHTKSCGEVRLVVSRRHRRTVVRKLDTCEVRRLEVVLEPASPARAAGACGEVAQDFATAWVQLDHERARSFWARPEDYDQHVRPTANEAPYAIDFGPNEIQGDRCRIQITERNETGCDAAWQLELEQDSGSWRLRSMGYVPTEHP